MPTTRATPNRFHFRARARSRLRIVTCVIDTSAGQRMVCFVVTLIFVLVVVQLGWPTATALAAAAASAAIAAAVVSGKPPALPIGFTDPSASSGTA